MINCVGMLETASDQDSQVPVRYLNKIKHVEDCRDLHRARDAPVEMCG